MERRVELQAVRALQEAKRGQHIYAYCHVQTKQVLYSLDRTLKPSALKQLPDVGANFTPPTLRKDVWRPLFSVHLPDTDNGRAQGLRAYEMLRQYRMLHETNWEPPLELSMKVSEKRKAELRKRLESRGGSKTEKVFNLIKREKKRVRQRMVMNQKANSVADLAAVLLQQGDEGSVKLGLQTEKQRQQRSEEVQEMRRLAKNKDKIMSRLRQERETLEADVAASGGAVGLKERHKQQIMIIDLEIEKIEFAAAAVARAEAQVAEKNSGVAKSPVQGQPINAGEGVLAESANEIGKADGGREGERHNELEHQRDPIDEFLPSFPAMLDAVKRPSGRARRAPRHLKEIAQNVENSRVYSNEGITVRWADILDAEYAEEWPAEVEHQRMGIVRNSHPKALDEPIEEISAFKALQWKHRKESWELEPDTLRKVQEIRSRMNLVEQPTKPSRLIDENQLGQFVRDQLKASGLTSAQLLDKHLADGAGEADSVENQQYQEIAAADSLESQTAEELAQKQADILQSATEQREAYLKGLQSELLKKVLPKLDKDSIYSRARLQGRKYDEDLQTALLQRKASNLDQPETSDQQRPTV